MAITIYGVTTKVIAGTRGRVNPNYGVNKQLLIRLVKGLLPTNLKEWNILAAALLVLGKDEVKRRNEDDIAKHWKRNCCIISNPNLSSKEVEITNECLLIQQQIDNKMKTGGSNEKYAVGFSNSDINGNVSSSNLKNEAKLLSHLMMMAATSHPLPLPPMTRPSSISRATMMPSIIIATL